MTEPGPVSSKIPEDDASNRGSSTRDIESPKRYRYARVASICLVQILIIALVCAVWLTSEFRKAGNESERDLSDVGASIARTFTDLLEHVDRALTAIKIEDLRHQGQIALTARLLRLELQVSPSSGLFLFDDSGRFLAGTNPLPSESRNVYEQNWFKSTSADLRISKIGLLPLAKSPLSGIEGSIVFRNIFDAQGKRAAIIGITLPRALLKETVAPPWLSRSTGITVLNGESGTIIISAEPGNTAGALEDANATATSVALWASRALQYFGISPDVVVNKAILGDVIIWRAEQNFILKYLISNWTTIFHHTLMVCIAIVALLSLINMGMFWPQRYHFSGSKLPFGAHREEVGLELNADWSWELDRRGNLLSVAGNFPEGIDCSSKRDFASVLGIKDPSDKNWKVLSEAIANRASVFGIRVSVPAEKDGPRMQKFEISGQRNDRTGGYWGVTVRIKENEGRKARLHKFEPCV